MVPTLLPKWEALRGGSYGRYRIDVPLDFAVAEAKFLLKAMGDVTPINFDPSLKVVPPLDPPDKKTAPLRVSIPKKCDDDVEYGPDDDDEPFIYDDY